MILKRIYHEKLAQASYLIGCPECGQAIVIDPNRDIQQYLQEAAAERLRIVAVTETHIHADYLSGSRELAAAAGAKLLLSDEGPAEWKYAVADEPNVVLLNDGVGFSIGAVQFEVKRTPGHTPEHISFLITDRGSSEEPLALISGDFVFVGEVGRPDLLEVAVGQKHSAAPAARELYHSLSTLADLPDHLLILPGHGAGSSCGKSLGGVPVSSLGYERLSNWAFRVGGEDAFVEHVLSGQPDPPKYFTQMKRLNKEGPPHLGGFRIPPRVPDADGALLVDVRPSPQYLAGHLPGSLHVPLGKTFINWAGWLIPYDTDLCLIASSEEAAVEGARDLAMIGLDRVVSWLHPTDLPGPLVTTPQILMRQVDSVLDGTVIDVRRPEEWQAAHVPGALHAPLGRSEEHLDDVPRDTKVYVHCQGGVRSVMAVSVLERAGFIDIVNIADGFAGYPMRVGR